MPKYAYEGLNFLDQELGRTGVISDDFKKVLWSGIFKVVEEAHQAGQLRMLQRCIAVGDRTPTEWEQNFLARNDPNNMGG